MDIVIIAAITIALAATRLHADNRAFGPPHARRTPYPERSPSS